MHIHGWDCARGAGDLPAGMPGCCLVPLSTEALHLGSCRPHNSFTTLHGGVIFLHSQGLKILKAGAKCDSRSRGWIHNRNSACDLTKAELFHLGPPLLWLPMNKSPEVAAGCCPSTSPSRAQKQLHYALLIVSAPPSFQLPGKYSWTRRAWQVGKIKQSKMLAPSEDGSVTVLAGLSCCHVSHTGKWRGRESSSAVGSSHSPVFVLFVFATVSAFST